MLETKKTLDYATGHGCDVIGCNHSDHGILFLHGRCHPKGKIEVSYKHGSGVLRVGCAECSQVIVEVKVAED